MEVVPVHWVLTEKVSSFRMRFPDEAEWVPNRHPIRREWRVAKQDGSENLQCQWLESAVEKETVQGVVFLHPYEDWVITWNTTLHGRLARYSMPEKSDRLFQCQTFLESDERGSFNPPFQEFPSPLFLPRVNEGECNIHLPWRKSDAMIAFEMLRQVQRYCQPDFCVEDEFEIWTKGPENWRNPLSSWTRKLDGTPAHPDPHDLA